MARYAGYCSCFYDEESNSEGYVAVHRRSSTRGNLPGVVVRMKHVVGFTKMISISWSHENG